MTFENIMTFHCRKKAHVNTACMSFLSTAYFSRYKGVTGSVLLMYVLDAVTLSQILKAKQKLGLTFDSDKLGVIDLTKLSKLTMCSA